MTVETRVFDIGPVELLLLGGAVLLTLGMIVFFAWMLRRADDRRTGDEA